MEESDGRISLMTAIISEYHYPFMIGVMSLDMLMLYLHIKPS